MFLPAFFFSSAHRRGMFLPEWVLINTGLRKTTTIDDKDKTKRSNKKQNTKREPLRLTAVFMGARSNTVPTRKRWWFAAQLPRVDESRRPAMSVLDVAAIASSRYWGWNDSRAPLPPSRRCQSYMVFVWCAFWNVTPLMVPCLWPRIHRSMTRRSSTVVIHIDEG